MNCLKLRGFIFHFFTLLAFLTVFCIQVNPASAVENGMVPMAEGEGNTLTLDFYSDHELCDATVRFEKPFEDVYLVFDMSSGKEPLESKTFKLGSMEAGQEITKVFFWELPEDFRKDRDSYTSRFSVRNGNETLAAQKLSFSYRNPTLSKFKLVDFSADSEKASALITLAGPTNFGSMRMPEPVMIDLDLKLLSGTEILYSESHENIPVMDAYYRAIYWPFLLEKDRNYTALLKVSSHSSGLTTAYRSDFRASEKVEILDQDIDVDEYGASVTVVGKSQVPFDGIVRVVLTSEDGEAQVFEETADILTAGKEDTVGIIWQGAPRGDYNVMIYAVNAEGKVMDSHETVLRVFEPVAEVTYSEKSPAFSLPTVLGIFLCVGVLLGRKKEGKKEKP